jgi:hypothetical protein
MSRNCSPWSSAEEDVLLTHSASGVPIPTIAHHHGRTPRAIKLRLERIALQHLLGGMPIPEVLRITGIPPPRQTVFDNLSAGKAVRQPTVRINFSSSKTVQTPVKTDSVRAVPPAVHPMFAHTLSRATLQAAPAERRLAAIRQAIDDSSNRTGMAVHHAASLGKTSYLVTLPLRNSSGLPPDLTLTPADILDGLKAKFPGCDVELHEEWVDVRPGVREHRSGIRIDWS